jgi:hypothetical protein
MISLGVSLDAVIRIVSRPSVIVVWNNQKIVINQLLNDAFARCTEEERFLLLVNCLNLLKEKAGFGTSSFSMTITKRFYPNIPDFSDDYATMVLWLGGVPKLLSPISETELEESFFRNGIISMTGKMSVLDKYIKLLIETFNFKEYTDGIFIKSSRIFVV